MGVILYIFVWVLDTFENIVPTKANHESSRARRTWVRTCEGADPAGCLGPLWPVVRSLNR